MRKKTFSAVFSISIVLGALTGVVTWTEFRNAERRPILSMFQIRNATQGIKVPQSVEVVTTIGNTGNADITAVDISQKLFAGFSVSDTRVTFPNTTRVPYRPVETPDELKSTLKVTIKPNEKLTISSILRSTLDSKTSNFTTTVTGTYRYPGVFGSGAEDRTLCQSSSILISVPLEACYPALKGIRDKAWLNYVLANNLCMKDRQVTDVEKSYLNNPTPENADKVLKSYLSEMNEIPEIGTDLVKEFPKLPDFKPANDTVKATEAIKVVAIRPASRQAFIAMFNEGIRDKRKYCSPLQALVWYANDNEFVGIDPIAVMASDSIEANIRARIYSFIDSVWKGTYKTSKWEDYQTVKDRLSTGKLVSLFMESNIFYDNEKYYEIQRTGTIPRTRGPAETLKLRKGICTEQAWFAYDCLSSNGHVFDGFDYHENPAAAILQIFKISRSQQTMEDHAVCIFRESKNQYYIINNGRLQGPFDSIRKAADRAVPGWGQYVFFSSYN